MSTSKGSASAAGGKKLAISVLLVSMYLIMFLNLFISQALPTIQNLFGVDTVASQWCSTAYMLVMGIMNPVSAYLIRKYSYKKIYAVLIAFIAAGSLICAFAPSIQLLILGRVVQAVGGGLGIPFILNMFVFLYPPEKRGTAMGVLGLAMMGASATAAILAGLAIQSIGLNNLFFIFAGIAVVLLFLGMKSLDIEKTNIDGKLDILAVILSGAGVATLLYGIMNSNALGWTSPVVLGLIACGIICLALFCRRCLGSSDPLLEIRIFKDRNFTKTLIIMLIALIMSFSFGIVMPQYLQNLRGMTPFSSALILLPSSLAGLVITYLGGKIFDRFGIKVLAVTGTLLYAVAAFLLSRITLETGMPTLIAFYTLSVFANSLISMSLQSALYETVDRSLIPHATALFNTMKSIGSAMGPAIMVLVMVTNMKSFIAANAPEYGDSVASFGSLYGMTRVFLVAGCMGVVAFILSLTYRQGRSQDK